MKITINIIVRVFKIGENGELLMSYQTTDEDVTDVVQKAILNHGCNIRIELLPNW